ncbi:MAG: 4-hydroxythreonine-4-phosphate dehydrogenase PdxA [Rhodospirillaceae bacterium]|nr:MAG: 4-hydroxythreonine-4-phosphate dehydrogenase PdxA [Rhodospirillaceae bacterium]
MTDAPLALTMGDPAGIGPDITLKAWIRFAENGRKLPPFFYIGDADHLRQIAARLDLPVPIQRLQSPAQTGGIFEHALPVLHRSLTVPPEPGHPTSENAPGIINAIQTAVELVKSGEASGIVTNPIAKEILYDAGFQFPGHTEYLAYLAGDHIQPVMMLACDQLRVVLATVHVSLFDAIKSLNTDTICNIARITHHALKQDFGIAEPRLAVAGLNPHAGEGGSMGREEIDIIIPAIKRLQSEGINATGPYPSDTMFTHKALPSYDAAVCMYHDQGLIPLKAMDFEHGVNTTLGLPFVRTSPDHGTAFDIAGTGQASELSLIAALNMAHSMAQTRSGE